jgi:tripartite-type tricarboxylate transporter receptor subunit TctC
MKITARSWVGALMLALSSQLAWGQTFPDRPVRFIVPYPPGGVAAPKATPGPVIAVLNHAFRQALDDQEIRTRWAELGSSIPPGSPEHFDALVKSEIDRLGQIVRETGAKAD